MQTANLDFLERTSKELPLVPACFQPYFVADISFQKKLVYYSFSTRIAGGNIQDRAPLSYVSYRSPPIFFRMLLVSLVVSTLFALLFPSPSPPFRTIFLTSLLPCAGCLLAVLFPGTSASFFSAYCLKPRFWYSSPILPGLNGQKKNTGRTVFFFCFSIFSFLFLLSLKTTRLSTVWCVMTEERKAEPGDVRTVISLSPPHCLPLGRVSRVRRRR